MLNLLLMLLVLLIVLYVVKLVVDALPLPGNVKSIVMLIVGLVFLLWLLRAIGVLGGGPLFGAPLGWF